MTTDADIRKPRAFAPDDPALNATAEAAGAPPGARETLLAGRKPRQPPPTSMRPTVAHLSRGIRWGAMLLSGIAGLAALATVLWFTRYVQVALERQDWLGWLAFALLCLVGLSALVLVLREIFGLMRLARLGKLRSDVKEALAERSLSHERRAVRHLKAVLSGRADLAWPLARFAEHEQAVLQARRPAGARRPRADDAARSGGAPHRAQLGQARRHGHGHEPHGVDRHAVRADREPAHAARHRRPLRRHGRGRSARCGWRASSSGTSSRRAASR